MGHMGYMLICWGTWGMGHMLTCWGTCLNLTLRLIQCWTFFVELGLKRIYIVSSIYKDFKKNVQEPEKLVHEFNGCANLYRGGGKW